MSDSAETYLDRTLGHLYYLSVEIGPRASTGEGERRAAEYAAEVMRAAGLQNVRLESFRGGQSTYRPYSLALATGLLGNLFYLLKPGRFWALLAAAANVLGTKGFYAEANFDPNWTRRASPVGSSQNAAGVIPARGQVRERVVLVGHLDTHRTPMIYSSPTWLRLFRTLKGAAFGSLILGVVAGAVGTLSGRRRSSWIAMLSAALQALGLAMTIQAETTPYSPGANDNASGAATVLALGERLVRHPLEHTEVWVVNPGCEDVGCYGMAALLDAHGVLLRDATFLDFDTVGIGQPAILMREGLLHSYHPDPELLELARHVARAHPGLVAGEHAMASYSDMGVVIKRGFRGLVIDSQLSPDHPAAERMAYWHQREDTFENIERDCLVKAHRFGWELLQEIDRRASG